jgi:hypothetical protein
VSMNWTSMAWTIKLLSAGIWVSIECVQLAIKIPSFWYERCILWERQGSTGNSIFMNNVTRTAPVERQCNQSIVNMATNLRE